MGDKRPMKYDLKWRFGFVDCSVFCTVYRMFRLKILMIFPLLFGTSSTTYMYTQVHLTGWCFIWEAEMCPFLISITAAELSDVVVILVCIVCIEHTIEQHTIQIRYFEMSKNSKWKHKADKMIPWAWLLLIWLYSIQ